MSNQVNEAPTGANAVTASGGSVQDKRVRAGGSGKVLSGVGRAAAWLGMAVLGFAVNEGLGWARDRALDREDQMGKIAAQQKEEFAALKNSLGKLERNLAASDRQAFSQVRSSLANLQDQNRDLLRMVTLARAENERNRQLAQANTGLNGGYDFILTEGGGLQLDDANALGVTIVQASRVVVNLTGVEKDERVELKPGQSVRYRAADGQDCRVSLLSVSARAQGASFSRLCNAATTS
jgi:hypothetical protein